MIFQMHKRSSKYKESLLQWIWENFEFNFSSLKSECGKPIQIIKAGRLNHGAGPDFLDAEIWIGELLFHGHVEIHKRSEEWYQHEHHQDAKYNNVILHVVFSSHKIGNPVKRQDQTAISVLNLKPHLSEPLANLLAKSQLPELPCGKHVNFINQNAFARQIEFAHREYFSYKAEELIQFYNSTLPVSNAWVDCLLSGIYYTLGIPGNREQMSELKKRVTSQIRPGSSLNEIQLVIHELAFNGEISWKLSGFRPANHPEKRTQQAATFHYAVHQVSFRRFVKEGVSCWNFILENIPPDLKPGDQMLSLLFNTVYLPACWLLGDLLHSKSLKQTALENWNSRQKHLPDSVKKPFLEAGFKFTGELEKLGVAHQLKRYCNELQCQDCKVFKSAIRS